MKKYIQRFWNLAVVQKIAHRLREGVDALLIIGGVFVLGMIVLFFNVFRIEIQGFFGTQPLRHAAAEVEFSTTSSVLSIEKEAHSEITNFFEQHTTTSSSLYEFHLRDYLNRSLTHYNLPLTTLPPGRRIIVESQGINAPIINVEYANQKQLEKGDFAEELTQGVVKYPGTSSPDQQGTTLLFGHSSVASYQSFDNPYGFVFYKLPKVEAGDGITVIRDGKLYKYVVEKKEIVNPKDVSTLVRHDDSRKKLVLMACYPLLSTAQRILVFADLTVDKTTSYSYLGDSRPLQTLRSQTNVAYQ